MFKPPHRMIAIILSCALVWTAGEGAQAAMSFTSYSPALPGSHLAFLRNQEQMRLETQALSLQEVNSRAMLEDPGRRLNIGGLKKSYRIAVDALEPFHPQFPSWFTKLDAAAVGTVLVLVALHAMGWLAPQNAVLFACGIVASIGRRTTREQLDSIEERFPLLARRGIQSAGLFTKFKVMAKVPLVARVPGIPIEEEEVLVSRFKGHKQWFGKREKRQKSFFRNMNHLLGKVEKEAEPEIPGETIQSMTGHTRYATTGADGKETVDQLAEAAQPHTMVPAEMLPEWVIGPDGHPRLTYNELEDVFDFNGDLVKMAKMQFRLFGRELQNEQLRPLLAQVHYQDLDAIPSGDCPTLAGLVALFHTQGFWFPSLKYANTVHVGKSPKMKPPSKERMKAWSFAFDQVFYEFTGHIQLKPGQSLDQIPQETLDQFIAIMQDFLQSPHHAEEFASTFIQDEQASRQFIDAVDDLRRSYGEKDRATLVRAAVNAFAKNSLEYAVMHEIKPRFHGSIAGNFNSTIVPPGVEDQHVGLFIGEPGSFVVDEEGQNATIGSDRRMLQVDSKDRWRYDMNSGVGEVLVLGHDGEKITVAIYSGPRNKPLSDQEILARRKDIRDPRQVDPLPKPDPRFPNDKAMESEIRLLPDQLITMHEKIASGEDEDFLNPAAELTRVLSRNRIDERIRRKIKINERDMPRQIARQILDEADVLSRENWALRMDEPALEKAVSEAAERYTSQLLELGFQADEAELDILFKRLEQLISHDGRPKRARAIEALKLLLMFFNPATYWVSGKRYLDRLEEAHYDIIFIGSEKAEYAGAQFGEDLALQWGFRQRSIPANDWVVASIRYRKDPEGFMKHFGIDPDRTILFFTSESGETYDTELSDQWASRLVTETFEMTGGKDNRLSDLSGRHRTFHFHNPLSMEETHLAAYAAMNHAFTELLMFMGENIGQRFQSKAFFDSPWTLQQWAQIRRSVRQMLIEKVPEILGYTSDHDRLSSLDPGSLKAGENLPAHQIINEQAIYYAAAIKERMRATWVRNAYLFLTVVVLGQGLATWGAIHIAGHSFSLIGQLALRLVDFGIYALLTILASLAIRRILKLIGKPTPSLLRRFGSPALLIVDYYDHVWKFASVMGRKAFGIAHEMNTPTIEGVKLTRASHERALTGDRRTSLLIGRADGRYPVLTILEESAKVLGKHARSILTIPFMWMKWLPFKILKTPISPHVVTYGSSDVPDLKKQNGWNRHIPLPNHESLPADVPDHVALFYGGRIDAFKRLLTVGRLLTTMAQDVGESFPHFEPGKTHPNTGSQTTPSPVPGETIIEVLAGMPLTVERIEEDPVDRSDPNPFKVVERVLISWTPELQAAVHQNGTHPQPTRKRTEWPKRERLVRAAS